MTYNYILALDPSGNFHEGKGTTGWCIYNATQNRIIIAGVIDSCFYPCMESYWDAHIKLLQSNLQQHRNMVIVIEDYMLYESRAASQINSKMETPKLIGVLQYFCFTQKLKYHMQLASEVKQRWANDILLRKGVIEDSNGGLHLLDSPAILSKHSLDAIRHAVHYAVFKNKYAK